MTNIKPIISGDWNEENKGTSNSQQLCDEFRLVDVWTSIYTQKRKLSKHIFADQDALTLH